MRSVGARPRRSAVDDVAVDACKLSSPGSSPSEEEAADGIVTRPEGSAAAEVGGGGQMMSKTKSAMRSWSQKSMCDVSECQEEEEELSNVTRGVDKTTTGVLP